MICKRCGTETPRLTLRQRRCPTCRREVDQAVRSHAAAHRPVWPFAKDLTGWLVAR